MEEIACDGAQYFDALYQRYFSRVLTVIRMRVSDLDEAEDLGMAVFEIAWTRVRSGELVGLPWLYQCARNLIGNEYQRRERNAKLRSRLVSDHTAYALVLPAESHHELAAAMRKLSRPERELLAMVYWRDLALRDVAAMIGTSEASVKMRVSRVRRKLHALLTSPRPVARGSSEWLTTRSA